MKKYHLRIIMALFSVLLLNHSVLAYTQPPVFAQSQSTNQPPNNESDRDEFEETYSNEDEQVSSVIPPEPPGSFGSEENQLPAESQAEETIESQESETISESQSSESFSEESSIQPSSIGSKAVRESRARQSQQQNNSEVTTSNQRTTTNFRLLLTLVLNRMYNNQMSMVNWYMNLINSDMIDLLSDSSVDALPYNIMATKYRLIVVSSVYLITSFFQ